MTYNAGVTEPTHAIILEGASSQLTEVRDALAQNGISADIVKPPGAKMNA